VTDTTAATAVDRWNALQPLIAAVTTSGIVPRLDDASKRLAPGVLRRDHGANQMISLEIRGLRHAGVAHRLIHTSTEFL
jgi:hypothetical protein